jgi:ComF family protein
MTSSITGIGWADSLLEFAFPPLCLGCGSYTDSVTQLCESCAGRIDRYTEPFCLKCKQQIFDSLVCPSCVHDTWLLFAFGNYVDPLKELVINFKFRGITTACDSVADDLCHQFSERIYSVEPTYLVPVPLHPMRELLRGYNQAEILARHIECLLQIPVATDFIMRSKRRKEQARLHEFQREQNVQGVFEAIADADPGERVILVDDVVTSGATVTEVRRVLIEAGFEVPACISIAHGA